MLFKLTKNVFATCYFGLAKSAKQLRKVCCVALCMAIALGLINLPTQMVYAKSSSWYVLPNSSPKIVRVKHWLGDYMYLRMISIKEAKAWSATSAKTVKEVTDAYVVQTSTPDNPYVANFYPVDFSRVIIMEDGNKVLEDDSGNTLQVENIITPALKISADWSKNGAITDLFHTPTKAELKRATDEHMNINVANIKPYRSASKISSPTLNALVQFGGINSTGDERHFFSARFWKNFYSEKDEPLDGISFEHDNNKIHLMPLTPGSGAIVQLDFNCHNDCKTRAAKGVRLKISYPKTLKAGEIACITAKLWGNNLSQSPITNKIYVIATRDAKLELLPMDVIGTSSEFPKQYKSFAKKATSKNGVLLGCDADVTLEGDGTIPAGGMTETAFSLKVSPLK